ncbi:glycoside hydrolase family 3 N-terminal domain-containing protein [Sulfobacillus harzensis]|uniref:Beta-glucosidase n=1 Tax=Sulfobacillus harzensis TaxID=2729629 RepID=A0A7Y0Q415_9FIRM|nr:glycoside hydrolase family 3 N-terminal domain-containing protein [Sulfobacillus harzensis]NMP24858.1 beta-glucosidase [Sulfobacillus harzensis]
MPSGNDEVVEELLARMTVEEKVAQLGAVWVYELLDGVEFSEEKAQQLLAHGIGHITRIGGASNLMPAETARLANRIQQFLIKETRLGIPALVHEEACSGYMARGATLFPQAIGTASTWNVDLVGQMATVISQQMRSVGAHQALAPLLDVARDARWGRLEETFGEDPYLTSRLGVAFVRGLQADGDWNQGVVATGKHYAGYGFSEGGLNWAPAHIPPREFHEIVLRPFEAAVKEARLESIMPGYHELDGLPMHAHIDLLRLLRRNWGFAGTVVSDYFGIAMLQDYHHVAQDRDAAARLALTAGVDVELPNRDAYGDALVEAVRDGRIAEELLNEAVRHVLRQKMKLGLFDAAMVDEPSVPEVFDDPRNDELALEIARQSLVLLKNEGSILPLQKSVASVAVIGPNADDLRNLMGDYAYPCHIETLLNLQKEGNVFSQPLPPSLTLNGVVGPLPTVLDAIRQKTGHVTYAKGCDVTGENRSGLDEARDVARQASVAILVVGDKSGLTLDATSGESRDRSDLRLPGVQEELIGTVLETGTPVVVVLVGGRPVSGGWMDRVAAIVEAWLPGTQGGTAIADVLFGDAEPAGRLPISFPRSAGHVPTYYNHKPSGGRSHWHGDYVDDLVSARFPFGYGLTYTRFRYGDSSVSLNWGVPRREIEVVVPVENVGTRSGVEVVQVYVRCPSESVTRPVKELKGFARVSLRPGQTRTVTVRIPLQELAFVNMDGKWALESGMAEVYLGSSSQTIHSVHRVEIPENVTWDNLSEFGSRATVS